MLVYWFSYFALSLFLFVLLPTFNCWVLIPNGNNRVITFRKYPHTFHLCALYDWLEGIANNLLNYVTRVPGVTIAKNKQFCLKSSSCDTRFESKRREIRAPRNGIQKTPNPGRKIDLIHSPSTVRRNHPAPNVTQINSCFQIFSFCDFGRRHDFTSAS